MYTYITYLCIVYIYILIYNNIYMPSDMGSRKLGSGRYRGLDEESHMPGFQNPMGQPVDPIL